MDYLEYVFTGDALSKISEPLIALLSLEGYEGFLEMEDRLCAYLPFHMRSETRLNELLDLLGGSGGISYSSNVLKDRNWNEEWEKGFEPILIGKEVYIQASFHPPASVDVIHSILIDPKMSFGTGHHETTRLMIKGMLGLDFRGKDVCDIGCGTGILSILASKMGARSVLAIDIDEWAYKNTLENIRLNDCHGIEVRQGTLKPGGNMRYSALLANINRNVILEQFSLYYDLVYNNGCLLLSGIRLEDEAVIKKAAIETGFSLESSLTEKEWLSMRFQK